MYNQINQVDVSWRDYLKETRLKEGFQPAFEALYSLLEDRLGNKHEPNTILKLLIFIGKDTNESSFWTFLKSLKMFLKNQSHTLKPDFEAFTEAYLKTKTIIFFFTIFIIYFKELITSRAGFKKKSYPPVASPIKFSHDTA
jgi:hypothetical protein